MTDFDLREQRLQSWREELRALELEAQLQQVSSQRNTALEQGEAALQSGDLEEAERCFRALFQAGPDLPGAEAAHDGLSRVYRLLGRRELDADNLPQARRVGDAWAELDPGADAPRLLLAEVERRSRKSRPRRYFLFSIIILGVAMLSVTWVMFDTAGSGVKREVHLGSAQEAVAAILPAELRLTPVGPTSPSPSEPAVKAAPVTAAPAASSPTAFASPTGDPAAAITPTLTRTATRTAVPTPTVPPTPTAAPTATRQPTRIVQPAPTVQAVAPAPPSPPAPAFAIPETMPAGMVKVVETYGFDPSRRFLIADQHAQTLIVWDPGNPLRLLPMSTGGGPEGYITPTWAGAVGRYVGTIASFDTYADDAWYLYESLGSILIHGAPYRFVDGKKQYEGLEALGNYPASHGCIRLSPEDIHWLTAWNPISVPIVILPFTFQVDLSQS